MADRYEAGYMGTLVSLGGVKGMPNRGRKLYSQYEAFVGADGRIVLGSNPGRISAIIQNVYTSAGHVVVALGDIVSGTEYTAYLQPGQSFQIDYNFPWTGIVLLNPQSTAICWVTEISVP